MVKRILKISLTMLDDTETSSSPKDVAPLSTPRPTDQELGGMTVNERLVVCGVLKKWDDAVRRRSREEMIEILRGVALSEQQATYTADTVLQNPARYGF